MVLLWHGSGPNERSVLKPLARAIAAMGHVVVVPDWQSDSVEEGRKDLLASLTASLDRASEFGATSRTIIGGWSFGANAAADVAFHPETVDGWQPSALVGIAGSYTTSPIRRRPVISDIANERPVPVVLIHGRADETVPIERSREVQRVLAANDWPADLYEPDVDHAGVIGAHYSRFRRRCIPARGLQAYDATHLIARRIGDLTSVG
jgi:predicted esterase